ncbi:proteasome subunit alpha type-1-like [Clavelina lepadiformis]|uniref:proteasome subunit alpha type-1-like n=1 Tax=Clavelina lepadiformis TaxID=159417 RepID=UPI004041E8B3
MFRNQYDNDVTVWSPQGRIHQIEYAMEAVKQGAATVGLKSNTHAVLVALKRSQSDLIAHQKKIERISPHIAISIAGLTSDARSLGNFMRTECMHQEFMFDSRLPVSRLVGIVGNKTQTPTQRYGRRPFGVGILVAGYDEKGPHIYQTCPSANYYNCKAMAIGSRSQSARTYLERKLNDFKDCTAEELVRHGLYALRETLPSEQELTVKNCSICVVGEDQDVVIYEDEMVAPFLGSLEDKPTPAQAQPAAVGRAEADLGPGLVPPISGQPQDRPDEDQPMDM